MSHASSPKIAAIDDLVLRLEYKAPTPCSKASYESGMTSSAVSLIPAAVHLGLRPCSGVAVGLYLTMNIPTLAIRL